METVCCSGKSITCGITLGWWRTLGVGDSVKLRRDIIYAEAEKGNEEVDTCC